jgi:hypothetical protein
MKCTLCVFCLAFLIDDCGGSSSPPTSPTSIQELHKSLTTGNESVELPFTWGQPTTNSLSDVASRVALFTFPPDPPDPRATIERIVVNGIHSESACPADFQITLISPKGTRFNVWNYEGPCEVAVRNDDTGGGISTTTFITDRELSGVAGEPLCMQCTNPAGSLDDYWKWQVTTKGLSTATATSSSHSPSPVTGMGDLGMTITFYYKALFKV